MFQVDIEGFSGPFDLLCHLIDRREIESSQISVSQVIAIYAAYLRATEHMPIASIAEFISQAAHLVREKTFSLLPQYAPQSEEDIIDDFAEDEPQNLEALLERYRPYREAAVKLAELKARAQKRRFRKGAAPDPFFDLGDLYSLAVQWLELLERRRAERAQLDLDVKDYDDDYFEDDGVPQQIPDEVQVENRMERILERLSAFTDGLSMRSLLKEEPGRASLVVTLLALLELSRRNRVALVQKELFGDVFITERS